jgi:hypothetical protein
LNVLNEPGLAAAAKKDAALASEIKSIKSQATAALKRHRSVQQPTGSKPMVPYAIAPPLWVIENRLSRVEPIQRRERALRHLSA